jgi:uncharacterized protein
MRFLSDSFQLTATDLANHLGCKHLTQLNRSVALGEIKKPDWNDPALAILAKRGAEHEKTYVDYLRNKGLNVVDLKNQSVDATLNAMVEGIDVITQATLVKGNWLGNADILLKVEGRSKFGNWCYEVQDTKLSLYTRAATVLQLCVYTDLLSHLQKSKPSRMYVVMPGNSFPTETFLFSDFQAYYRLIKENFEHAMVGPSAELYPDPVLQCAICRWWKKCDSRRHADDHLSLIAGIRSSHRAELVSQRIITLEQYAKEPEPLREKPERGNIESYRSIQDQAKIQWEGRIQNKLVYKLLNPQEGRGFYRLPEPTPGDIYFDIEGDPFFDQDGLEYLLGFSCRGAQDTLEYSALWALDRIAEKKAFEQFIDFVMERWKRNPNMYIYHYGIYEPAAIKRLTGRHGTRADEVDKLLRGERFVDIHAVIKESLKASVERYSLKDLEGFTTYKRKIDLPVAGISRRALECALELNEVASLPENTVQLVQDYNQDDCLATEAVHMWLEMLRKEINESGHVIPRPKIQDSEPNENIQNVQTRALALYKGLTEKLPEDRTTWNEAENAKWLLAHLIDYFRREDKSAWWEFYRVHEMNEDDLLDERKAVTGLRFVKSIELGPRAKTPIHRYEYPPQEVSLNEGDEVYEVKGEKIGTVHAIQLENYSIDIKKTGKTIDRHASSIHALERIDPGVLATSIMSVAESIIEDGLNDEGPYRAAKHLLLKKKPKLVVSYDGALLQPNEEVVAGAIRIASNLNRSVLAIQGPPGSGKTYAGAKMIIALVNAGKKVGVTAVSHKVIRNLFRKVIELDAGSIGCVHKVTEKNTGPSEGIVEVTKSSEAIDALSNKKVVGGTAWLWADNNSVETLDYLFVDEAGQMSLSQVLSASRAAKNLILLGDPQQLEQPQKGAHPEGSDVAALTYLLDGHKTMPNDKGLFLNVTRRLHPKISAFTSELFYESRLESLPGLEKQEIQGNTSFTGGGLYYVPVDHTGNTHKSKQEIKVIAKIVEQLTGSDVVWTTISNEKFKLQNDEILIVAPYNAQVGALRETLPDMRIGTVDKFQGQEAAVVVYSMTSSSPEDAPRGMNFLFNLNRFNVATSRAKCICILVASPRLMEPECHTIDQMRLANALCRYKEMATVVSIS